MKRRFIQKQIGNKFFQVAINYPGINRDTVEYLDFCILNVKNKRVGEIAKVIFMVKFYKNVEDIINKSKKLYFVFNFFGKVFTNERYGI